ncbi:MAG: CRTAC1 family protein [Phycisphaerales bacterium]
MNRAVHRWFRGVTATTTVALVLVINFGCEQPSQPPSVDQPVNRDEPSQPEETVGNGDPWFIETAQANGLEFIHDSGHHSRRLFPEITCGGAALFDMDGDGDLDAYLVQAGAITGDPADRPPNQLFRNRGDGTFQDITAGSGADHRGYGMGVASGDYDNDGDVDLYITNLGPNVLLRNDGAGHFTDVTDQAGVGDANWGSSVAFVDYDADGHLDLYVVNYVRWSVDVEHDCYAPVSAFDYCSPTSYDAPVRDTLYHNNGDGTFTDVSVEAGLSGAYGNGLGIVCADFNSDGRIDIFIANDGMNDQLWGNQGDGVFHDQAMLLGCAVDRDGKAKAGMGIAVADVDDDGDPDLLVVNLGDEADSFYLNEGHYFLDTTAAAGLTIVTRSFTRFGVAFHDFDNDGRLDLYQANGRVGWHSTAHREDDRYAEPNILLRGLSRGRFQEVRPRGGTAQLLIDTSRAAAFGDIDNDGGIDIVVINRDGPAYLLRNIVADRGHWIMFRVFDEHGRDATGATVIVTLDERVITRDVRTAYSYCAANDPRVHIGLGELTGIDNIVVRWVDGATEQFGSFDADQIITLRRSEGRPATQ